MTDAATSATSALCRPGDSTAPRGRTTHPASRGFFRARIVAGRDNNFPPEEGNVYFSDEYDGTVDTVQFTPDWTTNPDAAEPWEDDYSDRSFA